MNARGMGNDKLARTRPARARMGEVSARALEDDAVMLLAALGPAQKRSTSGVLEHLANTLASPR